MTFIPSASEAETSTTPTLLPATQPARRNGHWAWVVLVVGLMITAVAALYMKSSMERIAEGEFISQCNEIQNKITERLYDHARILRSAEAFFNASKMVTREKWHIFTQTQKVEAQLPGIQGIGFSLLIPRAELTRHVLQIRREGFPEYKVKPAGDREVYSSIIYLEPFSGRNLRAFGYDMFSEPVRRAAMERARDMDVAALSGKVVLVQETSSDIQAGTLMYIPVYRQGMPVETVEQRRAAIYGWVYSPYRMKDLMQGILGAGNLQSEKQLHLQVFDGVQPSPQSLLYESRPAGDQKPWLGLRFTRQIPVDFNGQRWTLRFIQTVGGFSTVGYLSAWLTMAGGTSITLLLVALIRALLNTRSEAQRIADHLMIKVSQLANEQRIILNVMAVGLCLLKDRKVVMANPAFDKILGYEVGGTLRLDTSEFYPSIEAYNSLGKDAYLAIAAGEIFTTDLEMKKKDGSLIWCILVGQIINWHKPEDGSIWMIQDITERKRAEEALRESEQKYHQLNETLEQRIKEAVDELRDKDRMLITQGRQAVMGEMIGNISHQWRQPLNMLGLLAQELLATYKHGKFSTEYIDDNVKKTMEIIQHMSKTIDDFRNFFQSDKEKVEFKVLEVIEKSMSLLEGSFKSHGIRTELKPTGNPSINGYPNEFAQVLLNMVNNAREALVAQEVDTPTITIRLCTEGGKVIVTISDNAGGIPEGILDKVFDPYFTTKGPAQGTGIGLYISKTIIEKHMGGSLTVRNVGPGAEFRIEV